MKTYRLNKNSELKNRTEQVSKGGNSRSARVLKVDFALRIKNRELPTEKLVALLQREAPEFLSIAEIVGKWVWIHFSEIQPVEVTARLLQLGFHWSRRREAWQHPCGVFHFRSGNTDPRERFGVRPAIVQPAA